MYRFAIADLETDGFLDVCTKIHCASITDATTGETTAYRPEDIPRFLEDIQRATFWINHNLLGFDKPVLERLHGIHWPRERSIDTLVISRTMFPDRPGGHSLKNLGLAIGAVKGDYGETTDWKEFDENMLTYNIQDNHVTRAVFLRQLQQLRWDWDDLRRIFGG